jgi:hypothetical protein
MGVVAKGEKAVGLPIFIMTKVRAFFSMLESLVANT